MKVQRLSHRSVIPDKYWKVEFELEMEFGKYKIWEFHYFVVLSLKLEIFPIPLVFHSWWWQGGDPTETASGPGLLSQAIPFLAGVALHTCSPVSISVRVRGPSKAQD